MNTLEQSNLARELIHDADAIFITAGAGMGVDSGLPDFRGDEGFWKAYPPMQKLNLCFSDMANPTWFDEDPHFAWTFYGHRLNLYRETKPHDGFSMLLDLVKEKNDNYFIFTSNVDGQFQKAGFDENKIVEVHGSIHHLQCTKKCTNKIWSAKGLHVEVDMKKFKAKNILTCKECGAVARPNIMMFDDWDWNEKRTKQQQVKMNKWIKQIKINNQKLVVIEIGAGKALPRVRITSEQVASKCNGQVIRINPRDSDFYKNIGISIPLGGLDGLKDIL